MTRAHNQSAAGLAPAACAPTGAHPPEARQPEWITARQRNDRSIWEPGDATTEEADQTEEAADAVPPETIDAADVAADAGYAARQPAESGLRAYGCAYHSAAQRLTVSRPKERATVQFHNHRCLKRVDHTQDGTGLIVQEAGDYEIAFELSLAAKAASPVNFELLAGDEALPGGTFTIILPGGIRQCRGGVMAALRAGDHIGVAMASVSVCEAALTAGGAMLTIKRLD